MQKKLFCIIILFLSQVNYIVGQSKGNIVEGKFLHIGKGYEDRLWSELRIGNLFIVREEVYLNLSIRRHKKKNSIGMEYITKKQNFTAMTLL